MDDDHPPSPKGARTGHPGAPDHARGTSPKGARTGHPGAPDHARGNGKGRHDASDHSYPAGPSKEDGGKNTPPSKEDGAKNLRSSKEERGKSDRTLKKEAAKETCERIRLAIWPTPELVADFKRSTGADLDLRRLHCDIPFLELWRDFNESSNPSTKKRDAIRARAKEVLGKKSKPSSSKGKSEYDSDFKNPGKGSKRDRVSERDSSSSSSTRAAPPAPKKQLSSDYRETEAQDLDLPSDSDDNSHEGQVLDEEPLSSPSPSRSRARFPPPLRWWQARPRRRSFPSFSSSTWATRRGRR